MPWSNFVSVSTFLSSVGAAPTIYIPIPAIPVDNADAPFAGTIKLYGSTQEMIDDGFLATDAAVLAVAEVFGQTAFTPTPPTRAAIIKRAIPVAQVEEFTVLAADDGDYKLFINVIGGSPVEAASFTAVAQTVTQIKDALISAFNLGPFAGTQTAADVDVDSGSITADVPGAPFVLTATGPNGAADFDIVTTTPNVGLYEDLDAAFAIQPFWAVIPDPSEAEGTMLEASRWAEDGEAVGSTRRNIALIQTADADIPNGVSPNFGEDLVALDRVTTFLWYHFNAVDKMTAALFGRYGGQDPGTRAWHGGVLGGTTETSNIVYTQAQGQNLRDTRTSWFEREAPAATADVVSFWGQGSGERFVVQKQAEHYWWLRTTFAITAVFKSLAGANLDDAGTAKFVAAVNAVNVELGTGEIPVIDLARTTVTPVPLSDVPLAEQELGDYKTTGGINVSTVLIPKIRDIAVSATFALA